jgi:glutaredoxin
MKARIALALVVALTGLTAVPVRAVTVVECVDKHGASSFQDRCPPGTVKKSEKQIRAPRKDADANAREAAKNNPVVLYAVANCEACDLVRKQLSARKIPFVEKTVDEDADAQATLKKAAGQLTVPTVTVGTQVFTGYSKDALEQGLTQAGYPEDKVVPPPVPAAEAPAPASEAPPAPEAPAPEATPADEPAPATES